MVCFLENFKFHSFFAFCRFGNSFVVNIFYRNGRFERIPPSIIPLFFSYFFALFFRVIRISKLFLLAFFASAFSHFDNPVIVL